MNRLSHHEPAFAGQLPVLVFSSGQPLTDGFLDGVLAASWLIGRAPSTIPFPAPGRRFVTLKDAGNYIQKLPKPGVAHWMHFGQRRVGSVRWTGNVFGPPLQIWASIIARVDLLMTAPLQSLAILECSLIEHSFSRMCARL
jgi:hypothetical protein